MSGPITSDNVQQYLYANLVDLFSPQDTLAVIPDAYPSRVAFNGNETDDLAGTAHFYIAHRNGDMVDYQMGSLSYFVRDGRSLVIRALDPSHPIDTTHLANLGRAERIGTRGGLVQRNLTPLEAKQAVAQSASLFASLNVYVGSSISQISSHPLQMMHTTLVELVANGLLLGRVSLSNLFLD